MLHFLLDIYIQEILPHHSWLKLHVHDPQSSKLWRDRYTNSSLLDSIMWALSILW